MKNYTLRETLIVISQLIGFVWLLHIDMRLCLIMYLINPEVILKRQPPEPPTHPRPCQNRPEQVPGSPPSGQ